MSLKQVILVRQDLKLPKGKIAAQVGHACVEATLRALKHDSHAVEQWRRHGMKKIVLKVAAESDLLRYMQYAKDNGIITALITDAGKTTVEPGTRTCLALGPGDEDKIDQITQDLPML